MARLDRQAIMLESVFRDIALSRSRSLREYHSLATRYHSLSNDLARQRLVESEPFVAAQVFYYCGDMAIGEMLVNTYESHSKDELRFLAHSVEKVVELRESLPRVLDTRSVPFRFEPKEDDFSIEGRFDEVERAAEE